MMRICGVTFDHTTNYGSCLQAYALQKVISQTEIDGELSEYALIPSGIILRKEMEKNAPKKGLKKRLINAGLKRIRHYQRKKFEPFEKEYLNYINCEDRNQLKNLNHKYDAFVCGSDVIWNFSYTRGDPLYFLDFAEKYKFSYAASLGKAVLNSNEEIIALPEPAENIYRKYINRLNQISVREKYAKEFLADYTAKTIDVCCDPTLLLTEKEWTKIADSYKAKRKYIFAYSTSTRPNFINFLKKLQKQTGLPVVQITWMPIDMIKQRTMLFPTPQRWLRLLHDAEYVVTNSFHGTVFSVLFHKTFFTAIQGERNVRNNVRLYDFLNYLSLDSQLFSETPDKIPLISPNYTFAEKQIAQIRDHSLKYIHNNLEAALKEKKQRTRLNSRQESRKC